MKRGAHTIQDTIKIVANVPTVLEDIVPGVRHSNCMVETSTVVLAGLKCSVSIPSPRS